jgi:hypothetical protein
MRAEIVHFPVNEIGSSDIGKVEVIGAIAGMGHFMLGMKKIKVAE